VPVWLAISLAVCSVLALAACIFVAVSSAPAVLRRQITVLRAEVQELSVQVEAFGQRWLSFKAEMEVLGEAIEDNLESAEKKRKRAAASASRAARAEPEVPLTPEERRFEISRRGRALGIV
jgi:hypothetical protein